MGRGYPEMSTLPLLAEELGVSIDSLFKGETQGIAIAGTTIVDIVNVIEKYPEKNMLVKILDTTYLRGEPSHEEIHSFHDSAAAGSRAVCLRRCRHR